MMPVEINFSTILNTLAVCGIAWVLRQIILMQSELLRVKLDLHTELNTGFRQINGRLNRVEEHMVGHEQLDDTRFSSIRKNFDDLRIIQKEERSKD